MFNRAHRYDIAIVGGGIVGLATACALGERLARHRIIVIEKERHLSTHQTGHNSGVIHAGIYYRPGSYKAKLCVEGARLLTGFCEANAVAYERCGKVIVAVDERELPALTVLYKRGQANGVAGLEIIDVERLKEIEPHARALRAIHSPQTAIVDYRAVAGAMETTLRQRDAEILTGARVVGVVHADGGLRLETTAGDVPTKNMINCGGLYADTIARLAGANPPLQIIPFRGDYYVLRSDRRHLVRGLIYPVPAPEFPFLGVHFTRTIHGEVEAGPNAVLAFAREGYTTFTIHPAEIMGSMSYRGFWAMAGRYWKTGLHEFYRSLSKRAFVRALKRLVPELEVSDVDPGGAGVRAQAVGRDGRLIDDFVILPTPNAIHVLNAPSPAATASLAIGRHIAELAIESFQLGRDS